VQAEREIRKPLLLAARGVSGLPDNREGSTGVSGGRLRRVAIVLAGIALLGSLLSGPGVVLQGCDESPTSPCGDCPGSVRWDSNVKRCRNTANGQFVKRCCCGY
jgi:hypothetical protein